MRLSLSTPSESLVYSASFIWPLYAKLTFSKEMMGGGSCSQSANRKLNTGGGFTSSVNPSASILSMIFCFDLA